MRSITFLPLWAGVLLAGILGSAARDDQPGQDQVEAEAMGQAAEADRQFKAGDFAAALPLYEAERTSRAKLGDLRYEAYAARAIGCCHERLGDLEAAIAAWNAARSLDAKREDRGFEGYDWLLIGQAQLHLNQPKSGVESLTRSLPLLSQAIDRDHESDARLLLAYAFTEQEDFESALKHLERSLELAHLLDDPQRKAAILAQMGRVDLIRDAAGPAVEWLSEAYEAYLALDNEQEAAAMDRLLGDALMDLDLPDVAIARVERAAEVHERLQAHALLADDLQFLAGIRTDMGNLPAARELARRAVAAYHTAEEPTGEIDALVVLARGHSLDKDWATAASTLTPALDLVRLHGTPADQVRLLLLAADLERRAKQNERAATLLGEAESIAKRSDNGALKRMVAEARQAFR
ncbi:hypothetical protein V5E97_20210 [Singulisphaera sp. Ch08]|uniref:Tetratricopeptide repeat protein n=1 Tax=Singulisphaera sp. Ch08 TaxID=3120278 RepID=A0AAU7CT14_9BACT